MFKSSLFIIAIKQFIVYTEEPEIGHGVML